MFNLFAFEKKQNELNSTKNTKKRTKQQELLCSRYRIRIHDQMKQLAAEAPEERPSSCHFAKRSFLKSRGNSTQCERLQEVQEKNKWLDTTPVDNSYKFRTRSKNKEIHPPMNFGHKKALSCTAEAQSLKSTPKNKMSLTGFFKRKKRYFKAIESVGLHNSLGTQTRDKLKEQLGLEKLGLSDSVSYKRTLLSTQAELTKQIKNSLKPNEIILTNEDLKPLSTELLEKFGYISANGRRRSVHRSTYKGKSFTQTST